MKECKLVAKVEAHLQKQGFRVGKEVPALSKRIDLVGVRENKIVAIEGKVRDWKRALVQANLDRVFANDVYVALHHKHVSRVHEELFEKLGIGIMSVNHKVVVIKKAKPSNIVHTSLAKKLMEALNDP